MEVNIKFQSHRNCCLIPQLKLIKTVAQGIITTIKTTRTRNLRRKLQTYASLLQTGKANMDFMQGIKQF